MRGAGNISGSSCLFGSSFFLRLKNIKNNCKKNTQKILNAGKNLAYWIYRKKEKKGDKKNER